MLALLAALCFLLVLLDLRSLGPIDLPVLGFLLLALHLVVPLGIPYLRRDRGA